MSKDFGPIEISTQQLVFDANESAAMLHLPLTDLADAAPSIDNHIYIRNRVRYPLANDNCTAGYFEQLAVRTETPEYKNAQNRVAVLIGESSLAANLPYIPEETIVLLDESKAMNIFMQHYIDSLRTVAGPAEWFESLSKFAPDEIVDDVWWQSNLWISEGRKHPLVHADAFFEAQSIARHKVILPWNADITDHSAMAELGTALKDRQAAVTMMNLTNVLPYARFFRHPRECAEYLSELPLTANAPILTTTMGSFSTSPFAGTPSGLEGNYVTGPFFGLDNLARAAVMDAGHALGAIAERHVSQAENDVVSGSLGRIVFGNTCMPIELADFFSALEQAEDLEPDDWRWPSH